MQSDEIFDLVWNEALKDANALHLTEAFLPHKWKRPAKILSGNETLPYDNVCDVKTFCWCICFDVIEMVVNCLEDRFVQAGYQALRNIEQLNYKKPSVI